MEVIPERRRQLAGVLAGTGIELGPGHVPFDVPPDVEVRFVDRWQPDEHADLFPDLPGATFPKPDVIANFDTDRLHPIADASQDFVICSHVLEHLAEPIGFIAEIYRVLRPGGLALIMLPDRRRTFDSSRSPTPLEHLVAEYDAGVTTVDDDHLTEFLLATTPNLASTIDATSVSAEERAANLEWHRQRSIHAHCWTDDEFLPVLMYGIEHLYQRWMLMDHVHPKATGWSSASC